MEILEERNYKDIIAQNKKNKKFTMLYFTASWCGPCKKLYPILNSILEKLDKDIKDNFLYKIDIDDNDLITQHYNIKSVPTILLINGNEKLYTVSGYNMNEIKELFKFVKNKYKDIFKK